MLWSCGVSFVWVRPGSAFLPFYAPPFPPSLSSVRTALYWVVLGSGTRGLVEYN